MVFLAENSQEMYQAVVTRYIEGAQVKRYACERPTASEAEALWLCYS